MNNPMLYNKCNGMTKIAAFYCLQEYGPIMAWKPKDDNAIDLGCGDGSVTSIIKEYMPSNYKTFVASDVNENMLKFARKIDSDTRTIYRMLDAGGDIPSDLSYKFNHVFSFFALHWIKDQEKVFNNVYNLLTDGGDCLLSILGYTPLYHIFKNLSCSNKWGSTWLKDINTFLSPYYDMQDIEEKVTQSLKTIGFSDIEVKNKELLYVFENGLEFKNLIKAVEPYHMPDDVFEDFARDCVAVGEEIGLLEKSGLELNEYEKKIKYKYCLIIIYARKL